MKKIFSFLTAILFAGSMWAAETTVYTGTFTSATGGSASYTSDVSLTLNDSSWTASYCYKSASEFRLGHNKNTGKVPTKFISTDTQGASLEMNFGYTYVSSFSVTLGSTYGTLSKVEIYESTDGGSTYTSVASTTTYNSAFTYTPTTPSSSKTRYAVVVSGTSSPRIVVTNVTIKRNVPDPTYAVTVTNPAHGTISVTGAEDLTKVKENVELSISVSGEGYTFTPRAFKTDDESTEVTISAGKLTMPAYAITITADEEVITTPNLQTSVAAITFNTIAKGEAIDPIVFTVSGVNLTAGNLSVALYDGTYFDVSPATIAVDGTLAATNITVTPKSTATAGTFEDILNISGGGATDVDLNITFTVQETYTINWYINDVETPFATQTSIEGAELEEPNDFSSFTNCSSFHFIGWKEGSAIDGGSSTSKPTLANVGTTVPASDKNYYAVFADGTPASTNTALDESLASGISTEGWTFNNKCYTNSSAVRMSTGSDPGVMTTPALSLLTSDVTATITFDAKAWSATENGKVTLSASTGTLATSEFETSSSSSFEELSTTLTGGDNTTTITFTGTAGNRINIKNVKVVQAIAEDFSKFYTTCPNTPTALDTTEAGVKAVKVLREGQIFILRGEKVYTLTGVEVR